MSVILESLTYVCAQKEPEKEQILKERGDVSTDRREQKCEAKLKASSSAPPRLQRVSRFDIVSLVLFLMFSLLHDCRRAINLRGGDL